MKPILFNTEMVRAILESRKTVTRRVVKPASHIRIQDNGLYTLYADGTLYENQHLEELGEYLKKPYKVNDVLYVRETWQSWSCAECDGYDCEPDNNFFGVYCSEPKYLYKASHDETYKGWKPSIYMPKEAARIFLRVTGIRVERLLDISEEQAWKEGVFSECSRCRSYNSLECQDCANEHEAYYAFMELWDRTIKENQRNSYGCEANPFVWVIEFERITKEQAYELDRR